VSDWRDGFLFLGNQLSLDFLNTAPVVDGSKLELLPDGGALARWLGAADLIPADQAKRLAKAWAEEADLSQLHAFREAWRKQVLRMETGERPAREFLRELNTLLAKYPQIGQVEAGDEGFVFRSLFAPEKPDAVFSAIAHSAADLIVSADLSRLRKCESCVLHFYDDSKKGSRRWCSTQMCGNRAKVSAYYWRHRAEG
jgi:predicted RNA-binding Zn ribbon-like protein